MFHILSYFLWLTKNDKMSREGEDKGSRAKNAVVKYVTRLFAHICWLSWWSKAKNFPFFSFFHFFFFPCLMLNYVFTRTSLPYHDCQHVWTLTLKNPTANRWHNKHKFLHYFNIKMYFCWQQKRTTRCCWKKCNRQSHISKIKKIEKKTGEKE